MPTENTAQQETMMMSAEEKLNGYAQGFQALDAAAIAANVRADFKIFAKDGVIYRKDDLPAHMAELRQSGDSMLLTEVVVGDGVAWCQWQVGDIVAAGRIHFSDEGVSEEHYFYR